MPGKPSVTFHLISLIAMGSLAYFVFSSPDTEPEKGTIILDVVPSDLSRITLVKQTKRVDVVPRKGGGFTLTVSEAPKTLESSLAFANLEQGKLPDDQGKPGDKENTPAAVGVPSISSYRANSIFEDKLDRLLPLRVERTIGVVTQEKIGKYDLEDPKITLEIEAKAQRVRYAVGGKTYGGATTYIQQLPDGAVYLLASDLMRSLDIKSKGFMERRLIGFKEGEIDSVSLEKDQNKQVLISRGKGRFGQWVPERNPNTKNTIFDNWVKNVLKTPINDYVSDENLVPELDNEVKIVLRKSDKILDTIEIASSKQQSRRGKTIFYARNQFVGQWVTLNSSDAERILSELPSVFESK